MIAVGGPTMSRAMTAQNAGGGSGAELRTLLMMRVKLQGPKGSSCLESKGRFRLDVCLHCWRTKDTIFYQFIELYCLEGKQLSILAQYLQQCPPNGLYYDESWSSNLLVADSRVVPNDMLSWFWL